MTIKVLCDCGSKYAFDVEPVNGQMPFTVNCPTCQADGTPAANAIIAGSMAVAAPESPAATPVSSGPRLRRSEVPPQPQTRVEAPLPMEQPNVKAAETLRKTREDAAKMRKAMWIVTGSALVVVALLGLYFWFSFFGSKPKIDYTVKLTGDYGYHMESLGDGKLLLASATTVLVRDIKANTELWKATLLAGEASEFGEVHVFVDKQNIWVCTGAHLCRLSRDDGKLTLTIPIEGRFVSFTPAGASLLVVSATDETGRVATRVNLASGETSTDKIEVPRAQLHAMPDELPPGVAPTAGVLLSQALEEQKFNKPITAISSEFFSAGDNLIELRVRLVEPKVTWVKAIKPRGPSVINGQLTAGTSTAAVAEEVFNDIKRDRTGGMKSVDESRYEVRLRRWLSAQPVEWKGEFAGKPSFFSLPTVDFITAGKTLSVFDKQNTKLFDAQLSYPISQRFSGGDEESGSGIPAAERDHVLYFFDQGVLTAFQLPGGTVKWRMPSIGIGRLHFDDRGMLYVDSTASSPEEIQYSEQIRFESTPPVILKTDPTTGKILWQVTDRGAECHFTGSYLFTTSTAMGGMGMLNGLSEAVSAPRFGAGPSFHLYRLDPDTGKTIWWATPKDYPHNAVFDQNRFVFEVGDTLQVWKFLTL